MWTIDARTGVGTVSVDESWSDLRDVTAKLYDDGAASMQITADEGWAHQGEGRMRLEGSVEAESLDGQMSLACDKIEWSKDDRLLVATGGVTGRVADARITNASFVRAKFESDSETEVVNPATQLALTALIATGQSIVITTPEVDLRCSQLTAQYNEDRTRLTWTGGGAPFTADWKARRLVVTGRSFEIIHAVEAIDGGEKLDLRSGSFKDNITAKFTDEDGSPVTISGLSECRVDAQAENRWKFSGTGSPFSFVWPDRGFQFTARSFSATGSIADDAQGNQYEWQTGTISGDVVATVTIRGETEDDPDRTFRATCPTVTIVRSKNEIILSGGVRLEGELSLLGPGETSLTAPKSIHIQFDEEFRTPTSITIDKDR